MDFSQTNEHHNYCSPILRLCAGRRTNKTKQMVANKQMVINETNIPHAMQNAHMDLVFFFDTFICSTHISRFHVHLFDNFFVDVYDLLHESLHLFDR